MYLFETFILQNKSLIKHQVFKVSKYVSYINKSKLYRFSVVFSTAWMEA